MHYNSARFYTELKDRSLPRFGVAVGSSFGISAVLYMAIASFGFLTFGGNSAGFILNNYSPYDPLANISRIAVGISVLVSTFILTESLYCHTLRSSSHGPKTALYKDGLPHCLLWSTRRLFGYV